MTDDQEAFSILAPAGSYRAGSLNQALISAARQVAPDHVEIVEFDLRTVPYYDGISRQPGIPNPSSNSRRPCDRGTPCCS